MTSMHSPALARGRALLETINPAFETGMAAKFEDLVPGLTETLIENAYGRIYARPGLDLKTRQIATVAALTAMGGHTAPQLKANIVHARTVGASREELIEVIYQMSIYGGMPAAINGLNAAREVFAAEDQAEDQAGSTR